MKIVIVGAGASGLMLSSLLNNTKNEVILLERNEHVGKKLLLTGNGRCNLTNKNLTPDKYNNEMAYDIATSFDTCKYFEKLGVMLTSDEEGRVYPLSNVSNTILDALRDSINNVTVFENFKVTAISKKDNKYVVSGKQNIEADIVVLAMGGKTYYTECNAYNIASSLGLSITPLKPSLNQIKIVEDLSSITNLRIKCNASLLIDGKKVFTDYGEVLFKKDAISGILMFQLSSIMNRYPFARCQISLDLLKDLSEEEINKYYETYHSLNGIFPKMIANYILKHNKGNVGHTIKNLMFEALEGNDFKNAQVTSGGINMNCLTSALECKHNPNIYAIGETLDIDGMCGGYNLQLAFASASIVFQDILKKESDGNEN